MTSNRSLREWVDAMARLCRPDRVAWCDGSESEKERLIQECLQTGELEALNRDQLPGCYLHRSDPRDVARTEHLTFICTPTREEAGPTNNWMAPGEAYRKLSAIFDGAMRGRTLYVVPFLMGPPGSPFSRVGVELTDSRYVALSMRIMTRMGEAALRQLGDSDDFTRGLHSKADLNPERRFICHFPQDNAIWSVGSGYGGNALLGKKCLALRMASGQGRKEGWLAEHMLILGVENPHGDVHYLAAAFPSACGKTNLAMLVPPDALKGYKVWTVGEDIAWIRIGPDGRLWATNPEAGFFGVVPGTNRRTNPNAVETIRRNTLYTNVAKKPDGSVWWEGADEPPPVQALDWKGDPWTPASGTRAAHPNSRFTAPARQCPCLSPRWEDPAGVPLSALVFGGRRATVVPLVYEAFDWRHGVFVGASMASETTAAQQGQAVGVVRRDPMAMLPFCGYNMADYFRHWLDMGERIAKPPKIFHVNWFRTDGQGRFLWPGFRENLRVLLWILDRVQGQGGAVRTPIGYVPTEDAVPRDGLAVSTPDWQALLAVDVPAWEKEAASLEEFFQLFGDRLPRGLVEQLNQLKERLKAAKRDGA
jgi:phosphoenolpyruvate carboxykinase (GTP)